MEVEFIFFFVNKKEHEEEEKGTCGGATGMDSKFPLGFLIGLSLKKG